MKKSAITLITLCLLSIVGSSQTSSWIRVNLLGYKPNGPKVAVWCSKNTGAVDSFRLVEVGSGRKVYTGKVAKAFGAYGPFEQTCRLDFSDYTIAGRYILQAGDAVSETFSIAADVYKNSADFCLRYMRQQRSGFNPFLNDSCHTHDGYTLYGESAGLKDSTHIDVSGGWHDATDYLQYASTSANATYHLLMSWRDFPKVFGDQHQANGLKGSNGRADVLDEARWGLDWLLKMHPRPDWLFNQLADDRDHTGFRLPKEDPFYNKGFERPVYFVTGEPQQRAKFLNITTGTSSIAGKFSSAFALGAYLLSKEDPSYANRLRTRSFTALDFANRKHGFTQTASVKVPYIYEESNWVDDMELAYAAVNRIGTPSTHYLNQAQQYAALEPNTPWLGRDSARHYQWYPFVNVGHYELAGQLKGRERDKIISFMRSGIEKVWQKAGKNAFYRGIPYIWCSNNLTVAFALQCYWYRKLTSDNTYLPLEQSCFDWIFGCNPWGTSMVFGLPSWGDTPVDPHSSLTHLYQYPLDGGLVDGPVYTSIFNNLYGLVLSKPDAYAQFQSNLAVYHDDFGDYSTNEPTMDGTATLIYLLAAKEAEQYPAKK
ncbi:MAG: hypothetical protein RL732_444 [Bacteroidota bacterium]